MLVAIASIDTARAQTWLASPVDNNYNNNANWNPAAPVNNGNTTGFFGSSSVTSISNSAFFNVGGWTFNAGASNYQFTLGSNGSFSGIGITVNGGSVSIDTNGHLLQFNGSSTAGASSLIANGAGGLQFTNSTTAGNAVITNNNSNVDFFNNATAGNAAITNNGVNAAVDFSFTTGLTGNHQVSAGSLAGGGTFSLGSNSLTVGGNNQSTTVAGVISDGGFGGGTGASLVKVGTGVLTLSGVNTYTGGTTVNGGTLALSGAATLGTPAGSATVNGGGTLDLGGTTQTLSGLSLNGGTIQNGNLGAPITSTGGTITGIGGTASLTTTAGTTVVTGTNTFAGPAVVNGGILDVIGSITDPTVNSGGTLTGTGTVGATQVNAGGNLAPGSGTPGSSMTITGNLAFQSGAFYLVQVNPSTASFATVTGSATLGGATVNAIFAPGSYVSKQYTILTATGGVSGTFGSLINTNLPSNFHTTLSYDANDVYMNLVLSFGIPGGINGNQQAVGNALTNFFNSNGGIPLIYSTLTPAGLTQASGESATGSQQATFNAMGQFMGLLTDPFTGRGGGINGSSTMGYAEEVDPASTETARRRNDAFAAFTKAPSAPFAQRWSVWAAGYGGSQSTNGNAAVGSNDATSRIAGTAVGADYLFSPDTLAGFALAGGGTSFSVNTLGSGRSDLFQAGAYVRHTSGAAYVTGALAYGWQDVTTNRTVTIAGIDQLRAEFNANAWSGRAEGGYRFVAPWIEGVGITPYAAGQFTTFDLPAYAETVVSGAPNFALSYAARSVTDARSELGIRTDKSFAMMNGVLTLRSRLAWAHDFDPNRSIAATFQALPGASFVVNGAAQASDSALTTASAEMRWMNGWSALGTFEGEFSNVTRSYAGKGSVRYQW